MLESSSQSDLYTVVKKKEVSAPSCATCNDINLPPTPHRHKDDCKRTTFTVNDKKQMYE